MHDDQPYLESCCRSALHRMVLAGEAGRPGTEKDAPCLARLARRGLAAERDGRWRVTRAGAACHARTVLKTL